MDGTNQNETMIKYEYAILSNWNNNDELLAKLNQMGEEGWRVSQVLQGGVHYMEREVNMLIDIEDPKIVINVPIDDTLPKPLDEGYYCANREAGLTACFKHCEGCKGIEKQRILDAANGHAKSRQDSFFDALDKETSSRERFEKGFNGKIFKLGAMWAYRHINGGFNEREI